MSAGKFLVLKFSGSSGIEAAIDWIVDHENDPDIDEMPRVSLAVSSLSYFFMAMNSFYLGMLMSLTPGSCTEPVNHAAMIRNRFSLLLMCKLCSNIYPSALFA